MVRSAENPFPVGTLVRVKQTWSKMNSSPRRSVGVVTRPSEDIRNAAWVHIYGREICFLHAELEAAK